MSDTGNQNVHFERVAFYGRRWADYMGFLHLDEAMLAGKRVLDVAAGTSSFAVEAAERGVEVSAIDPLYALEPDAARVRAEEDFAMVMQAIVDKPDYLANTTYATLEDLKAARWAAAERFLIDYREQWGEARYRPLSLPELPFADGEFDYAFCGHFLFLFADRLEHDFHRDALLELSRVAKEVRVYPLFDTTGTTYPRLDKLRGELEARGRRTEKVPVNYSVISGECALLRITRQ